MAANPSQSEVKMVGIERMLDKHPRPDPEALSPCPTLSPPGGPTLAAVIAPAAAKVFDRTCTLGSNGDEHRYNQTFIGNFHKGLMHHQATGLVDPERYKKKLRDEVLAVGKGHPEVFENIPLAGKRKMTNPQAGLAKDVEGPDPGCWQICAAPRL